MKTRTKFVIMAVISLYACFVANIILSAMGKEMLSDGFCIAWVGAFTVELGLLAGITIKGKGDSE